MFKTKWAHCCGGRCRRTPRRSPNGRRPRPGSDGRHPVRLQQSPCSARQFLPAASRVGPLHDAGSTRTTGRPAAFAGTGAVRRRTREGARRLHEERFQDCAPAAVQATLLDEGQFLCSVRTMYRILEHAGESCDRREQRIHPPYQKPELLATAPNQVWSWDITKLRGPVKWTYFYLMWCSTSSAATLQAGWWRRGRAASWPGVFSKRPSASTTSQLAN